ncbi:MAG: ABC transporter substrate-binding protein [Pseudomonadota bacterium]
MQIILIIIMYLNGINGALRMSAGFSMNSIKIFFSKIYALLGLLALTQVGVAYADAQKSNRVISAGGSITEIVYALGLYEQLVAVDTSSLYPPQNADLPKIGYFRNLGTEGILALSPDVFVAARGAGPTQVLDQLADFGVEVKQFEQSIYTMESWRKLVADIGEFFGVEEQADSLIASVSVNIESISQAQAEREQPLNAIALLNSGQRGNVAAGVETVPDLLFNLAGINNLAKGQTGFKPFSSEVLAGGKLDIVFVPEHTLASMGGVEGVCAEQAIQIATDGECKVHVMDSLLLLGFGARVDQALQAVVEAISTLP